jgi:hypothetical protein
MAKQSIMVGADSIASTHLMATEEPREREDWPWGTNITFNCILVMTKIPPTRINA